MLKAMQRQSSFYVFENNLLWSVKQQKRTQLNFMKVEDNVTRLQQVDKENCIVIQHLENIPQRLKTKKVGATKEYTKKSLSAFPPCFV